MIRKLVSSAGALSVIYLYLTLRKRIAILQLENNKNALEYNAWFNIFTILLIFVIIVSLLTWFIKAVPLGYLAIISQVILIYGIVFAFAGVTDKDNARYWHVPKNAGHMVLITFTRIRELEAKNGEYLVYLAENPTKNDNVRAQIKKAGDIMFTFPKNAKNMRQLNTAATGKIKKDTEFILVGKDNIKQIPKNESQKALHQYFNIIGK